MARADDVLALARAALENDRAKITSMCNIIVANEPDNSSLRSRLKRVLERMPSGMVMQQFVPADLKGLVLEINATTRMADVVLPQGVSVELGEFLGEQQQSDAIREMGLHAPHKILLSGPPGNGKTTLAGAIANSLELPFLVLDFSSVLSSYMGETGAKIAKVFRGLVARPSVLFLDEMETVLVERNSKGDVGEMKRIVSTVLMEIDRLPDHVILIGATNHPEMLDRAVVRRFDHHWTLPAPDEAMVARWLQSFVKQYPEIPVLKEMPDTQLTGASLSDIERRVKQWCRRWIVEHASLREHGDRVMLADAA